MGYWGYGGFGNGWGSPTGAPWLGGYPPLNGPPVYGAPVVMPGNGPATDIFGHGQPEKKPGGITGFFQGIAQGGVNLVKGIFSPGGILALGAVGALTWMTGGAILPILGAVGAGVGGYQILKGIADGDTRKMGEGVFGLGTSLLGFLGPEKVVVGGQNYQLAGSGLKSKMGALFGGTKYVNGQEELNLYQVLSRQMGAKVNGLSNSLRSSAPASNTSASTGATTLQSARSIALRAEQEQKVNAMLANDAFCQKTFCDSNYQALQNMQTKLANGKPLNDFDAWRMNYWHTKLNHFENPPPSLWSRMRGRGNQTSQPTASQASTPKKRWFGWFMKKPRTASGSTPGLDHTV